QLVNAIIFGPNGDTWVGTVNGLFKINGTVFRRYSIADGLVSNNVLSLAYDNDGNLLVGTPRGLSILNGEHVIYDVRNNHLVNQVINAMAVGQNGYIYFATKAGALVYDGLNLYHFTQYYGFSGLNAKAMYIDRSGLAWALADNGINQYVTRLHWRAITMENGFPQRALGVRGGIVQDRAGRIWIGCDGLSMFDGVDWHHYNKDNGLSEESITSLYEDENGLLWIGTVNGLIRYDGDIWRTIIMANNSLDAFIENRTVQAFQDDRNNNMYIAVDDRIAVFDGNEIVEEYLLPDSTYGITAMTLDSSGTVWAGTKSQGIFSVNEENIFYTEENLLSDNRITALLTDMKGRIWVGSEAGVACYSDSFNNLHLSGSIYNDPINPAVTGISLAPDSSVWYSTKTKLYKYHDSLPVSQKNPFNGTRDISINSIAVYSDTSIWLGTNETGLVEYTGWQWKIYSPLTGLYRWHIHSVNIDYEGTLWFATQDTGIIRFGTPTWSSIAESNGIHSNEISTLYIDKNENIWIGMPGDISVIQGKDIPFESNINEVSIANSESVEPSFLLHQNYPNPFNAFGRSGTKISVTCDVSLFAHFAIYSVTGQLIQFFDEKWFEPGIHTYIWNGQNENGIPVASGIYIYRFRSPYFTVSKTLLLLK
ncbi:two-component regulator propeller domain-containing protein, partial [candidate division KSB1 bacterium]